MTGQRTKGTTLRELLGAQGFALPPRSPGEEAA